MATLIDYARHFQRMPFRYELRSDTVALYYTILELFNSARFPESLTIATDILQRASGISKRDKFYEARNLLKELGLIEFKSNRARGDAKYSMPIDGETNPERVPNRRFIYNPLDSLKTQTRPRASEIGDNGNGNTSQRPKRRF